MAASPADRIALGALDAALVLAHEAGEDRPAHEILAGVARGYELSAG